MSSNTCVYILCNTGVTSQIMSQDLSLLLTTD